MFKTSLAGLLASALMLTAFASWAQSESQQVRERIVEQVLKPCEGKKAGDKVVMVDRRGGEHEAICTLAAVPLPEQVAAFATPSATLILTLFYAFGSG